MIEKLQYISNGDTPQQHLQHIALACEAGVKWVQLRLKNVEFNDYVFYACEAKRITSANGAVLIINDNPQVAALASAHGVHVGKEDISAADARGKLMGSFLVGGTANTFEDIELRVNEKVDYIGLGPYRFTTTKQKLSPVLGVQGYREIIEKMKQKGYSTPVIAIGGIELTDIAEIMVTGVHGIAVSGLITRAGNKKECVKSILKEIEQTNIHTL